MKKNIIFFLSAVLFYSCSSGTHSKNAVHTQTSNAYWIWYPGDYEIWLHRELSLKRNNRSAMDAPFFRLDAPYGLIRFTKNVSIREKEFVSIKATGRYTVIIDDKYQPDTTTCFSLDTGNHTLRIDVVNYSSLPALYLSGTTIFSDSSWKVSCGEKKEYPAASGVFRNPDVTPLRFDFSYSIQEPMTMEKTDSGELVDFGKETYGILQLKNISGSGLVTVYYGESKEEALSNEHCETFDFARITKDSSQFTMPVSRAMRYVRLAHGKDVKITAVSLLYEYLPLQYLGSFKCSNHELNKIWDLSAYSLHLTTREFFIDGIKRDRWVWSGDAAQSILMNFYVFFDKDVVKRTLIGLRQKDPVTRHINHIVDYSYYWLISVYDYYMYTGDKKFVEMIYPKMVSLMDFCNSRLNKEGFSEGLPGDWVFLDWAPFDHKGEMSAYQLLLTRSLEAMAECANVMNDKEGATKYAKQAEEIKKKIFSVFWDTKQNIFLHNRVNGIVKKDITRYPNMFALLFNYVNEQQAASIKKNVLLNDGVLKITTPYMRFYELASLCESGEQTKVTEEMLSYWGGMIKLGATSFWEVFDPKESGTQHLAMYGRPFGRSLCHSWGASPVYLLGRYYFGVYPLTPGFETFMVRPNLGGLQWIEGTVPVNGGIVSVYMNTSEIKVTTTRSGGVLKFRSQGTPSANIGTVVKKDGNSYELKLEKTGTEYLIKY